MAEVITVLDDDFLESIMLDGEDTNGDSDKNGNGAT